MTQYVIRRLLTASITMAMLVIATFSMVRFLPGDVISVMTEGSDTVETREHLEELLGLNKSAPDQFVDYIGGLARGDLGDSLVSGMPVRSAILDRLPVTLQLMLMALVISSFAGVAVGLISATFRDQPIDYALRTFVVLALATPNFWIATMVLVYGALWFSWTPPQNYAALWADPLENLKQMWLPAVIAGLSLGASLARMTRTMMLEELRQDHIRTAVAKGLIYRRAVLGHALPNVLIPVLTMLGIQAAALVSGTVILEQIFGIPGIGRYLIGAIGARDYTVVQGIVVVVGTLVIMINLFVDLSYAVVDPRIRVS